MSKSCEFVIGLTAFFTDGTKELFTVTHTGIDEESARYSMWHEFKNIGDKIGVEYVTTTVLPFTSKGVPPCTASRVVHNSHEARRCFSD